MTDRLLTDARVITPRGVERGNIAVAGGEVAAVGPAVDESDAGPDPEVTDADGMLALPGVVDVHNHLHDDELFPDGIDFASGTASAVAGGVTTVVELPTQTPVTTPAAFRAKREACEALAHVDFGLVAGNVQNAAAVDVEAVMAEGTPDFKTFTADPYLAEDGEILALMEAVGEAGGKVRVHCETQAILDHARAKTEGDDPEVYMDSRPLEAELDAISRMGRFAEYSECPLHVVHVSSGSGAREGARFKSRAHVPVTLETCPHYLAFSKADVAQHGPFLKVNPSLKSEAEVERLWSAVADGTIDLVASEHFPTYEASREAGWEDIWEPYAGLPGIETTLEFLASEGVGEGRIGWARLHELLCARPAREAGVYPQKGSLRPGTDADIVLLREGEYRVSADDHAFVGNWTPYEGRTWTYAVDTVLSGGEVAARDHEVRSAPGDGTFLPRGPGVHGA